MTDLAIAAMLAGLTVVASIVSIEFGVSVAIIEIALGVFAANVFGIRPTPWIDFVGGFAGIVLTFLAGAEVDPTLLRRQWRPAVFIGGLSFLLPFVTDLGTALALSILFVQPSRYLILFIVVSVLVIGIMVAFQQRFFTRYGSRVIEPEIKGAFFALFVLMWAADLARSHAVLPAFVLGLSVAHVFQRHREELRRFRVVSFAFLTPIFFLKGGLNVDLKYLATGAGLLGLFLALKIVTKFAGVLPVALRYVRPHAVFTTLLMSTGLTFGTISSLYGLNAGIIDRGQFTILVGAVIGSAVVPTVIAQRFFAPPVHDLTAEERTEIEDEEFEPGI